MNYLIVLYAFVIPLSRAGVSVISVLLIVIWIAEGDFQRKFEQLKRNKIILAILSYILYTILSRAWTNIESIPHGADQSFKIIRLILLPIMVIVTSLRYYYVPKVILSFLLGMLVSETISYGIFFEIWSFGHGIPTNPSPVMNHLDYSVFLAFTSLLILNIVAHSENMKIKFMYFIYFMFAVSNLFINGGRTGQVAFLIALIVFSFLNIKNKLKAFIVCFILSISIFGLAYNISPIFEHRLQEAIGEINKFDSNSAVKHEGSFGQRVASWIIASDMISANPFFGTGAGSEMVEFNKYLLNNSQFSSNPYLQNYAHFHNEYIHVTVEYGLVGLILYLAIWYFLLRTKLYDKKMSALRAVFVSVWLTATLFDLTFHAQLPMSLFALFIGIFIVSNQIKSDIRKN